MKNLYLSLKSNYGIKVKPKAGNKLEFEQMMEELKKIPVIKFIKEREEKYWLSYLFHLGSIYKIARENGYNIFITDKLENVHKRFCLRKERIQQERENEKFESSLWTDNPEYKILGYQAKAVNAIYSARRFLEGDDMGCGKTPIAIGVMCKAFENDYQKALVICPNRLKYQWKDEVVKFTKIKEEDVTVVDIYKKLPCPKGVVDCLNLMSTECKSCERKDNCKLERNTTFKVAKYLSGGKIVIMNYELLDRMKELVMKNNFDIVIFDEASRMKNVQTQTFKAISKINNSLPKDAIVIPMSGTFIENRIDEIYPPLSLVHKGILGEYYNFKNRYLIFDFWGKPVGIRNEKKLKKLLDPWIIRRSIDEVWKDRPPLIEIEKVCEMTEVQRKIYEDAKAGALQELKDKGAEDKINFAEIGALLNYLIQICDTTEAIDPAIKESGKMDVLKELVTEEIARRHKVLIFSFFANKVIPIIKRELSSIGDVMVITGAVDADEGERIKQRFINSNSAKFLICSDSMGYGANLQVARYVINYDLPWNPAKISQRIARAYRRGQEKSVTAINLVTPHSVEDKILEKIGNKRKLFDQFLGISTVKKSKLSLEDMLDILRSK